MHVLLHKYEFWRSVKVLGSQESVSKFLKLPLRSESRESKGMKKVVFVLSALVLTRVEFYEFLQ